MRALRGCVRVHRGRLYCVGRAAGLKAYECFVVSLLDVAVGNRIRFARMFAREGAHASLLGICHMDSCAGRVYAFAVRSSFSASMFGLVQSSRLGSVSLPVCDRRTGGVDRLACYAALTWNMCSNYSRIGVHSAVNISAICTYGSMRSLTGAFSRT